MARFESETCGRCGGTGKHSYCQMYGDTCFKCQGRGVIYTTRGLAAKQWFEARLSKPASELKAGEKIFVDNYFTRGWGEVIEVKPDTTLYNGELRPDYVDVQTTKGGMCIAKDELCRVAHTAEEKQAVLAQALEYQATLTKAGTPMKRKKATA